MGNKLLIRVDIKILELRCWVFMYLFLEIISDCDYFCYKWGDFISVDCCLISLSIVFGMIKVFLIDSDFLNFKFRKLWNE